MSKQVTVQWQKERSFLARTGENSTVIIDGSHTGQAMSASELLLAALGGCVSTTVIGVLEKKRQQVSTYEVEVDGEQMPDWPKSYTSIHITYRVRGANIDVAAVERAVELAETKYCTVSGSLRPAITHSVEVIQEPEPVPA